jgi:hypothetical protein
VYIRMIKNIYRIEKSILVGRCQSKNDAE